MKELKDLVVGDKVIYRRSYSEKECVKTIKRITNTLIILENEARFDRIKGYIKGGGSWDYRQIYVATDDKIKSILNRQYKDGLIQRIKVQSWGDVSTEKIEEILSILNR